MELANTGIWVNRLPVKVIAALTVGLLLVIWFFLTPAGALGKADAIGYAVCHRIDLRSFHLGDRQLPLCVRCSGMFVAAFLGLGYQAWLAPRRAGFPHWKIWAVMAGLFLAFAVDGVNSYLHLFPGFRGIYEPHHALRLLTGTGMGLVISMILYPAFQQTAWRNWDPAPPISGLGGVAALLGLGLGLAGLVWLQNPLLLYPLALLSAGGVVALLTIVYTMVALMIFRMENRSLVFSDLALPLICGLGLAFLQIGGIDLIRYWITGTWDGFHFG